MFSLFILARVDDPYTRLAPLVFAICFATFAARMQIIQGRLTRSEAQLRLDIAERTRTEQALRQSEERYRGLFEHSPFGIFLSQPDGTIIDANTALVAMLRYSSKEELMAQNLTKDVYQSVEERRSAIEKCEETGRVQGVEVKGQRRCCR